jgi:uncharacterized membrane protein YhaH (DUF805 family)/RNA polymerase subunit RPABC4/transcription elongation factor Spt4
MKCEKCGAEVADGVAFCPSCGTRAIPTQQLPACGKCGETIPEGTKFCAKCGAPAQFQDLKCRKCGGDIPSGTRFCPSCGNPAVHGTGAPASSDPFTSAANGDLPPDATYQYFIQAVTKKFADFSGRARRREYWFYVLFAFIAGFVLGLIPVIGQLACLALVVPGAAITARRLHDIGKSGWLQLIGFVPLVGWIIVLIWTTKDSDPGVNQYGPNPKA